MENETNETKKVIDREGTLLTSFHSIQLDWLVKQNPKKEIGYTVLYGNSETEYDGDKQIITLTSSADNQEMVNKGYLPIAVYCGDITESDGEINMKKHASATIERSKGISKNNNRIFNLEDKRTNIKKTPNSIKSGI